MPTLTPNYSFNLPLVNDPTDADLWGGQLNANWTALDSDLKAVSDVADAAAAGGPEPGDVCWSWRATKSGWVIGQGTIGSATSGATNRASADTEDLFVVLWDQLADAQAPVSGGRGASGAADFAANKTITLPDGRGVAPIGRDDMGGTSANRITVAGCGFDGDILGNTGGSQFLQTHTHIATVTDPTHTHGVDTYAVPTGAGVGIPQSDTAVPGGDSVTKGAATGVTVSNANAGAGSSQNVQPSLVMNIFYKL